MEVLVLVLKVHVDINCRHPLWHDALQHFTCLGAIKTTKLASNCDWIKTLQGSIVVGTDLKQSLYAI